MKATWISILVLSLGMSLYAQRGDQNIDDLLFGDETTQSENASDDLIQVNYEKKSAHLAMAASLLVPGLGQYYADGSWLRTLVYPVIEIGLIGGLVYFNSRGNSKTEDYELYANGETIDLVLGDYNYQGPRYNRNYQIEVENHLMGLVSDDIYDGTFFRLDSSNTQHFYEDIGKYDKYVFGWADWYHTFAAHPGSSDFALDDPAFEGAFVMSSDDFTAKWLANHTIQDMMDGNFDNQVPYNSSTSSMMRREYIQMRKDAEAEYSTARIISMGIVANHVASAIDAAFMTSARNRLYISQSPIKLQYNTVLVSNELTPMLNLSYRF